jgi:hypothetical protein
VRYSCICKEYLAFRLCASFLQCLQDGHVTLCAERYVYYASTYTELARKSCMLPCRVQNSKEWETVNIAMHGLQQLLYFNNYRLLDQQERTARLRANDPAQLAPGSHILRAAACGQSDARFIDLYEAISEAPDSHDSPDAASSKMQWPPWTRIASNTELRCSHCWQAMRVPVLYQHWQRLLA